jgi:hypothetical protein
MAVCDSIHSQCLFLIESGNTREDLALKELQRGTTSSRDVRHVTGASTEHFNFGADVLANVDTDVSKSSERYRQIWQATGGSMIERSSVHHRTIAIRAAEDSQQIAGSSEGSSGAAR